MRKAGDRGGGVAIGQRRTIDAAGHEPGSTLCVMRRPRRRPAADITGPFRNRRFCCYDRLREGEHEVP